MNARMARLIEEKEKEKAERQKNIDRLKKESEELEKAKKK